jgi:hypothetical protein
LTEHLSMEKPIMRKGLRSTVLTLAIGMLAAITALAVAGEAAIDTEVQVAPQTIILGADQGGTVTVHAAIAYGLVDRDTIALNGLPAKGTKADARGELVAFFDEDAVKAMVGVPSAMLTLTGVTNDGVAFSGSDTVRVIQDPSPGPTQPGR